MSIQKAIEICKNLTITIENMKPNIYLKHEKEIFEIPRAKKSELVKIKKRLTKKIESSGTKNE